MSQMNPRPEAQPQTYDSLSKTQQRAVSGILQYLDQFVAKAPFPTAESETMVRLDLNRPSNVVLIDGERGSGKTETLLTLLGFLAPTVALYYSLFALAVLALRCTCDVAFAIAPFRSARIT